MTLPNSRTLTTAALLLFCASSFAQTKEIIKKKDLTLTFINEDKTFSPAVKTKLINTFFKVYPVLKKEYNENALKEVTFVIDTAYKGVAATANGRVAFSPVWFRQHPEDIDVVTHEVMHIVQDYGKTDAPWWITEGIADYARYKFGVSNETAKWTLPDYKPTQKYQDSYRITARFFVWLEKEGYPGIVKNLDQQMRNHTYTDAFWKGQTNKTLTELWAAYAMNPAIS